MTVNQLVLSKPPSICIDFICVSLIKLCVNAGKKRKKKERNHPCPSVYNLVGEINNTNKITEDIWNVYSLSKGPSQSTEETKASLGYCSQLQIHGGSGHLKGVLN